LGKLEGLGLPRGRRGLETLVRLGLLRPIARGLYEVRSPSGVSQTTFELVLAARFADRPHLVSGWWALALAGLTNQDVREAVVLTISNRRDLDVAGRHAHVVKVDVHQLWGGTKRASGVVVASPERALCDCAGRRSTRIPATRLAEAVDAYLASKPAAAARLAHAVKRYRSPAAARRLGFLVELAAGEDAASPFRSLIGSSNRADALDPGDTRAPIVSRWRVRTQLGADELFEHRHVS
jgi:predicted transcriptional regulator of viral defense system